MAHTNFIVIDENEKRISRGHYNDIGAFVASLVKSPETIEQFNTNYKTITGQPFYINGNRPKVPEELSLDMIRRVIGMQTQSDNELLD